MTVLARFGLILPLLVVAACGGGRGVCDGVTCSAQGSCVVSDGVAACRCRSGTIADGLTCVADPCASSSCVNGTCSASGSTAVCACEPGYAGARCDGCAPGYHVEGLTCAAGSPCADDPCRYGTCQSLGGVTTCACWVGYAGTLCDACAAGYQPVDLKCVGVSACDPDPCVYGVCTDVNGAAVCACDTGYTGTRCDACAPGYHESGLTCVSDGGSPCDPNPCTAAHETMCTVSGATFACSCDPGYALDGTVCVVADGGVSADDAAVAADGAPASTDAAPDGADGAPVTPSTCAVAFSLPDHGYATVALHADVANNWVTAIPLTKNGTTWQVVTPVPYGRDVEYKFVADGTWMVNPSQPTITLPSPTVANTNNILQAVTCGLPAVGVLELVNGTVTTSASSYSFQVRYVPGAADLDTSKTVITLNGTPLGAGAVPYDASTHLFTVSVASGITAPDKLGYLFQVQDTNGNPARLFVPFWIEGTTFDWRDSFMYEIMVDRFVPGGTGTAGPNGAPTDPVGDWKGGDFGGVTQKINDGYFDAMGVNTLWLSSPVLGTKLCEMGSGANAGHCLSGYHSYFPLASGWTYGSERDPLFTGHGITNPIEPHFGAAADLTALVNAAHRRGIRVLTDLVVNHVFADPSPPNGQTAQLGPLWLAHQTDLAWFNVPYNSSYNDCGAQNLWDTSESQTWNRADCWFDPYLPDFNTTNPSVDDAIADHAVWLMQQFNLDGFRVDAVKQVANPICLDLRAKIDAAIATSLPFYMVGEALGGVVGNVMDCVGPDRLNGSVDDPLHNTIVGTILQGDANAGTDLDNGVQYDEATWTGAVPSALMGHFFGSHDTPRAISLANGDDVGDPWTNPPPQHETSATAFSRLQLAHAFLLTYDSIPIIWMGDEFGMPGAIDPDCRRMMRFGAALSAQEQTTLTNLQKLGTARAAHLALRRGSRTRLAVNASFYAYARVDGADIVVAAFNFGSGQTTQTVSVSGVGLSGTVTDALSGATATVSGGTLTITLPALTAAVYAH